MEPPQARAFVRLASVENPTARNLHSERLYDPQGNGLGYSNVEKYLKVRLKEIAKWKQASLAADYPTPEPHAGNPGHNTGGAGAAR